MKKQAGFTLIELVMVIVILGILAAVALPKFVNLSGDARKATLTAAEGAIRSTANSVHGASLAAASSVVTIENTPYTMVNNYPAAANIAALAGVNGSGYTATVAGTTATVQVTGAATPASCQVTYTEAAAGAAPAIAITNTGC